jgi:hypothetical protein
VKRIFEQRHANAQLGKAIGFNQVEAQNLVTIWPAKVKNSCWLYFKSAPGLG